MGLRIHYLQHFAPETPGMISEWSALRGHSLRGTEMFADHPLPDLHNVDALVVMGGPMGVHDEQEYPWLVAEKAYIKEALSAGKPTLGICLGAQLIAHVLGAKIKSNHCQEIGWFPVHPTPAADELSIFPTTGPINVCHWHGDTFDIPEGATHLASSPACVNQAFLYKDFALGLQFHLEFLPETLTALADHFPDALTAGDWVQPREKLLREDAPFPDSRTRLFYTLDRWLRAR